MNVRDVNQPERAGVERHRGSTIAGSVRGRGAKSIRESRWQMADGKWQMANAKCQRLIAIPRWFGRIRPTGGANQKCQPTQPTRISYAVCVPTAMPKPRMTKTQAKNTPAIQRNTKANQVNASPGVPAW